MKGGVIGVFVIGKAMRRRFEGILELAFVLTEAAVLSVTVRV